MTIAAGFVANDGVLLFADSQYTALDKTYRSKILPLEFPPSMAVAFVLAGDEDYAKSIIEDCREAITESLSDAPSVWSVRKTIRRVVNAGLHSYHQWHPEKEQQPEFLVAIATHAEGAHLFSTREAAMSPVAQYDCRGTGAYLANYIIDTIYHPGLTILELTILALHVLYAAKKHDANCGGGSHFLSIRDGVPSPIIPYDPEETEKEIGEYLGRANGLLLDVADCGLKDERFIDRCGQFEANLIAIRKRIIEAAKPYQELVASLSGRSRSATSS